MHRISVFLKQIARINALLFTVTVILETGEVYNFDQAVYSKISFNSTHQEAWGPDAVKKKYPSSRKSKKLGGAYEMEDRRQYWVVMDEKNQTILGMFPDGSVSEIYRGVAGKKDKNERFKFAGGKPDVPIHIMPQFRAE